VLLAKADQKSLGDDLMELDKPLAKGFRRIALWDDTQLIENAKNLIETGTSDAPLTRELLHSVLWCSEKPEDGTLEQVQDFLISRKGLLHDLKELFSWLIAHRTPLPKIQFDKETGP